jgi:hypothetical protein
LAQFLRVPISYFFDDLDHSEASRDKDGKLAQGMFTSDRETLEIMKAFKHIKSYTIRKRSADLFRALADTAAGGDMPSIHSELLRRPHA